MIELRWVYRAARIKNPDGTDVPGMVSTTQKEKVLQYRQRVPQGAYAGVAPQFDVYVWSDWRDVPTVSETPPPTEAGSPQP